MRDAASLRDSKPDDALRSVLPVVAGLELAELREAIETVKRRDAAVELGWWDDWSVVLAESAEKLLANQAALLDLIGRAVDGEAAWGDVTELQAFLVEGVANLGTTE